MTEKEAFEDFAKSHELCLRTVDTMGGPSYSDCNTDYAWLAWQASRQQALEQAEAACEEIAADYHDAEQQFPAVPISACIYAIRSLTPTGEKA